MRPACDFERKAPALYISTSLLANLISCNFTRTTNKSPAQVLAKTRFFAKYNIYRWSSWPHGTDFCLVTHQYKILQRTQHSVLIAQCSSEQGEFVRRNTPFKFFSEVPTDSPRNNLVESARLNIPQPKLSKVKWHVQNKALGATQEEHIGTKNRARSLEINAYINQIKIHVFNDVNVDIQTSKPEINSNIVKLWLAILQNQLTWRHVGFRALAPITSSCSPLLSGSQNHQHPVLEMLQGVQAKLLWLLASSFFWEVINMLYPYVPKTILREHPAHDHPMQGKLAARPPSETCLLTGLHS